MREMRASPAECTAQSAARTPHPASKRRKLSPTPLQAAASGRPLPSEVTLLDYGAGNVRSVRNALKRIGYTVKDVSKPCTAADRGFRMCRSVAGSPHCVVQVESIGDIQQAEKLVFPGVGAFEQAMGRLNSLGYKQALKDYVLVRLSLLPAWFTGFLTQRPLRLLPSQVPFCTTVSMPQAGRSSSKKPLCRRDAPFSASAWASTCCMRAAMRMGELRAWASSLDA